MFNMIAVASSGVRQRAYRTPVKYWNTAVHIPKLSE
jgi:hypothetical protein